MIKQKSDLKHLAQRRYIDEHIGGLRGYGGPLPYAVSKSGINQLAFEPGMRLGMESGIRVNSAAPAMH